MDHCEYTEKKKKELVDVAQRMVAGTYDLIEGCREIVSLRHEIDDPDNEVFTPIRGIESDSDDYPKGSVRSHYQKDFLERLDKEETEYLSRTKSVIITSCEEIIKEFS